MKLQLRFLVLWAVLLIAGCGSGDPAQQESNQIKLGDRSYFLDLPAGYQPQQQYKLLLAFHGSGGSSGNMQNTANFTRYSDDYIVAYPQAGTTEWNEGCKCNIANRLGIDDLGFVDALIADVSAKHRIATGEVYAAGFSQGGLFTQNLACNRSSSFKAFAVVAAPMSDQLWQSCAPAQPV